MNKKLLLRVAAFAVLAVLCLAVFTAPATAVDVYVEVDNAEDLKNNLTKKADNTYYTIVVTKDIDDFPYDESVVTITGNITLTTLPNTPAKVTWTVTSGNNGMVRIQDNGHLTIRDNGTTGILTLEGNDGGSRSLIYVGDGSGNTGKLTIFGGNLTGNTYKNGAAVYVVQNSMFEMTGGSIVGNTASNSGSVHCLGTFILSGGRIADNTGTGVYMDSGRFTLSKTAIITKNTGVGVNLVDDTEFSMTGGTISENTGGVVMNSGSIFTMSGGDIVQNKNPNDKGGGVYVYGNKFAMSGGTIDGNEAKNGGGVYVVAGHDFEMSGTARIIGNTAAENGGGIYNAESTGSNHYIFDIRGGEISGNRVIAADGQGGGIYTVENPTPNPYTFTLSGSTVIKENTAGGKPNNVYLEKGRFIAINSPLTSGSSIGVTTKITPTADTPTSVTKEDENYASYASYFFADNPAEFHTEYNTTSKSIVLALGVTKSALTWELNGGTASNDYTKGSVAYGTAIVEPDVSREGYTFVKWNPAPPATMPAHDVTIEAVWNKNPEPQPEPKPQPKPEPKPQGSTTWIQGEEYSLYTATLENGGTAYFQDDTFVSVAMPQGFSGDVSLTTPFYADTGGLETYKIVDIAVSSPLPYDSFAIISFALPETELQARGYEADEVHLYHQEGGVWVKLKTVCYTEGGIVYGEAKTVNFSAFAVVFEEKPAVIPTTAEPAPTETESAGFGILAVLLGLAVVSMRRK